MTTAVAFRAADPLSPVFDALLASHAAFCQAASPPGSCHFLDRPALADPRVQFFGLFDPAGQPLACGALARLSGDSSARRLELKCMHTLAAWRGQGLARRLLRELLAVAGGQADQLLLETGSDRCRGDAFAPARALYRSEGFQPCPPFADYRPDPYSQFMQRALP